MTGRWFSPCIPVSSTNKANFHDIFEILLKVALNTISPKEVIRGRKSKNDRQYICTMVNRKRIKGKTMIYNTLHRKLNIEQHEPQKNEGKLGCMNRKAVPALLVATVVQPSC